MAGRGAEDECGWEPLKMEHFIGADQHSKQLDLALALPGSNPTLIPATAASSTVVAN